MYKIMSSSRYGTEQVDQADTLKEARYLLQEYRLAFGSGFTIYIKKGRKIIY